MQHKKQTDMDKDIHKHIKLSPGHYMYRDIR